LSIKKRPSDSIDNDYITVLVLPAVAADHLLFQTIKYPGNVNDMMNTRDRALLQHVAAIEAALTVVERFLPIALILFLIIAFNDCWKRAIAVRMIGLLCFAAEAYLNFKAAHLAGGQGSFT